MKKNILLLVALGFCLTVTIHAQNLLKNGNLTEGVGRDVPGWIFSDSVGISKESRLAVQDGKIVWSRVKYLGDSSLAISMPEPVHAHVWWRQDVKAVGGLSYRLSLQVSGTGHPHARGEAGVYFRNGDGSWGKYMAIPQFEVTAKWQTYTLDFTVPDNATSVTVRLGADNPGKDAVDVHFANIVLITK